MHVAVAVPKVATNIFDGDLALGYQVLCSRKSAVQMLRGEARTQTTDHNMMVKDKVK